MENLIQIANILLLFSWDHFTMIMFKISNILLCFVCLFWDYFFNYLGETGYFGLLPFLLLKFTITRLHGLKFKISKILKLEI